MPRKSDSLCPFHTTANEWNDCLCARLSKARSEGEVDEVFAPAFGGWHDALCHHPRLPGRQCHCAILRKARAESAATSALLLH